MRKVTALLAALVLAAAAGVAGAQEQPRGPKVPKPDKDEVGKKSAEVMAACALSTTTHDGVLVPHLDVWWKVSNESGDEQTEDLPFSVSVRAFATEQGREKEGAGLIALNTSVFPIGPGTLLLGPAGSPTDCYGPLCDGSQPPDAPADDEGVVAFAVCENGFPVAAFDTARGANTEVIMYLGQQSDNKILGASACEQVLDPNPLDGVSPPDTENIDIEQIRDLCAQ